MRIGVLGASVSQGGTIGGATIGPGSTIGVTPGPCPTGYQLDDTGQICLPVGAIETTGGETIPPCIPKGSMGPLATGQTYCPEPLPPNTPASEGYCPAGTGLFQNSVCIPLSSPMWNQIPVTAPKQLISGIDNNLLYAAGGLLLVFVLMGGRR